MTVWSILCYMSSDPHPHVAEMANKIVNYIKNQVIRFFILLHVRIAVYTYYNETFRQLN